MERIRDQVSGLCRGWDVGQISQIVTDGLTDVISALCRDRQHRPVTARQVDTVRQGM
jgi:hypothetical protein